LKYLKAFFHIIIVVLLTLITQVGGIIWIGVFAYFKYRRSTWNKRKRLWSFSFVYALCVFFIVPILAPLNSRKALPVFNDRIAPHNLGYVLLCRNYVHNDLFNYMAFHSRNYHNGTSGLQLIYLDAGFPFIDGFPLLPHLSHNDAGFWQYDYAKYLGFNIYKDLTIDEALTNFMIDDMLEFLPAEKIFMEPHLIPRLELDQLPSHQRSKIRYHGCHAVRHDDHFHLQIYKDY
jgi:hypothetical protein